MVGLAVLGGDGREVGNCCGGDGLLDCSLDRLGLSSSVDRDIFLEDLGANGVSNGGDGRGGGCDSLL